MGLSKSALERKFADLPAELNMEFLNKSMNGLRESLQRTFGDDLDRKIETLERKKTDFLAGKVDPKYFCKENGYAIVFVLAELRVQRLAKPRTGGIKV